MSGLCWSGDAGNGLTNFALFNREQQITTMTSLIYIAL